MHLTRVPCPACGNDLLPAGFTQKDDRVYFRSCSNGCGSWFYDGRERLMRKLD